MSEDFEGDFAGVMLKVTAYGMDDVRIYLDEQQKAISKVRIENASLMDENTRLHKINDELHAYLKEERKRLKPDGPLVSRKTLLMAVELLEDGGVINEWDDTGQDLRYEIKQVTQHEET